MASAIYFVVKERKGEEIEMTLLFKVNWAFYSMASPAAILVSIVYWSALYDRKYMFTYIVKHIQIASFEKKVI